MISSFVFVLALTASADLTEREVMDHVLSELPTVKASREDVRASEGGVKRAEGAFDIYLESQAVRYTGDYEYDYINTRLVKPTAIFGLDLYAGFRKGTGTIPLYDGQYETLSDGEWNFGLKLPLLRGFLIDERRARLQKSELELDQQRYELQATELEQVRNALHRYWEWRLAVQRYNIQRDLLEIANVRDTWLARRSKAGDVAKFEQYDNQRSILQRQSALLQAEQQLVQARAELEYYILEPALRERLRIDFKGDAFPLPETVSVFTKNTDYLVKMAFEKRPELKAYSAKREQFQVDKDLQTNQYFPQLDFEAQQSQDRGTGSTSLDDKNTRLSVNFQLPLQYRRARGGVAQADANISSMGYQIKALEQRIRADIASLQKSLSTALKRRDLATEEVVLARRLEDGERLRLRQGETNILMVNLREQAKAEAELRFAETSVDALKHYVSLKTALGHTPGTPLPN